MAAPVILVEARPRSAVDGGTIVVRLAGAGATRPYYYDGQHWRAGLTGLPKSVAKLDFDGEQLGGGGVSQAMEIGWAPGSRAALDELAGLIWADAPITVRIGPEGADLPPIDTSGLGLDTAVQDGTLRVALADGAVDLKRPLLTDRYAGTGGIEGPSEWQDRIKPRLWGRCFNVLGQLIDEAANIWVFGDPRRPIESFESVRTRGVDGSPLPTLAWQGSSEDTYASLHATPAPEGGGIRCPSINAVKWWTSLSGDLRADLRGENEGGYVETAPEIAARIVAARSALPFGTGEIAAAVSARPAPFGWLVDSDSVTASDQLSSLLADVSVSWLLVDGKIVLRPWDWSPPVRSARSHAVTRTSVLKPMASRKLGYHRNQAPMQRSDIAAAVLAGDVVYQSGETAEELKPAEAGATNSSNPTSAFGPDKTIAEARAEIVAAQADIAAAQADVDAAQNGLASAQASIAAAQADIDAAIAEVGQANTQIATLFAAARDLTQQAVGNAAMLTARADQLAAQADLTIQAALQSQLLAEGSRLRAEALATLGGQQVKLVLRQEMIDREDGDSRIREVISLLGIVTADSSSFILDLDKLLVSPTETFASRLTELTADLQSRTEAHASYTSLVEVNATETEARTQALVQLTAEMNGKLSTKASVTQLTEASASQAQALAQAITQLQATLDGEIDTKASNTRLDQAIADQNSARASALLQLQAELDGEIDTKASNTRLDQAIADQNSARASALLELEAELKGEIDTKASSTTLNQAFAAATSAAATSLQQVQAQIQSQIGPDALNRNSTFGVWPDAAGAPTAWYAPENSRVAGKSSPYAVRLSGGGELGIDADHLPRIVGGGYFIVAADIRATGQMADVLIGLQGFAEGAGSPSYGFGWNLGENAPVDFGGAIVTTALYDEQHRYRFFIDARSEPSRSWKIYVDVAAGSTVIEVDRLDFRPATDAEIAAQQAKADVATKASVVELNQAKADLSAATAMAFQQLEAELQGTINTKASNTRLDQAITDQNSARASALLELKAELDSEIDTKASNTRLDQAITDQNSARASALLQLQAELDSEIDTKASNTRLDQAIADQNSARASALLQLQAELDSEIDAKASNTRLDQVIADQNSARASALLQLQAELDSEIDTKASSTTLNQAVADTASAAATALQQAQAQLQGQVNTKASSTQLSEAIATEQQARAVGYDTLTGSIGAQSGRINELRTIVATPIGTMAKAVFLLDVNGHVVGTYETNNGSTGDIVFVFDHFTWLRPDGTPMISNVDDELFLPKVRINMLDTNTAVTPTWIGTEAGTAGAGIGTYNRTLSRNVDLKQRSIIEVTVDAQQTFTDNERYRFRIFIDGQQVRDTSEKRGQDLVHLSSRLACDAGPRTAYVEWSGDVGATLDAADFYVRVLNNTTEI